jgi:hypothetical protein
MEAEVDELARAAAEALVEDVDLLVEDLDVDDRPRQLEPGSAGAPQLGREQRQIVGTVHPDQRHRRGPVLAEELDQLGEETLERDAVGLHVGGVDAVDVRGLLGDLDAGIDEPRALDRGLVAADEDGAALDRASGERVGPG